MLRVPVAALTRGGPSGRSLYVVRGGKAHLVHPEFGYGSETALEVLSGLSADDLVVTNPEALAGRGKVVPVEVRPDPPSK